MNDWMQPARGGVMAERGDADARGGRDDAEAEGVGVSRPDATPLWTIEDAFLTADFGCWFSALGKAVCSELCMSMNVRRPPSHVQVERLKGGGRLLSAFPTAGQQTLFGKGLREHVKRHLISGGG
jgi:hypothetical protein